MEVFEEIGDTFKEIAKSIVALADVNSCLMEIDITPRPNYREG
jgi:hypothetical protein